ACILAQRAIGVVELVVGWSRLVAGSGLRVSGGARRGRGGIIRRHVARPCLRRSCKTHQKNQCEGKRRAPGCLVLHCGSPKNASPAREKRPSGLTIAGPKKGILGLHAAKAWRRGKLSWARRNGTRKTFVESTRPILSRRSILCGWQGRNA